MKKFNFYDYLNLQSDQVLKIKLKNQDSWLFVKRVSQSVLQSYKPAFTPVTKINLCIIKDLDLYRRNNNDETNFYERKVEPEEIDEFEFMKHEDIYGFWLW